MLTQGDLATSPPSKKAGGEAGGTSPPFEPSDGGGRIPPEGNFRERAFDPPPGKSRRRGRLMPAKPSISSIMIGSDHDLISLFEHDLVGKPVPAFPDHALRSWTLSPLQGAARQSATTHRS